MTITSAPINTQPLLLDVSNTTLIVTPEQFDRLCIDNPDLRLELTQNRELIVMPPTGGETGRRNGNLFARVWNWNDQTKLGDVFDSSTGYDFTAIGGGKPSPDVSWIEKSRLDGIDIKGFIPVVPDFVIELRSATDRLNDVQTKMIDYQRLGVKLGILVNPQNRTVEIYRLGQELQVLESPMSISCEDVMPGFVLSMNEIW
ncbi:MAG: Uma2 family endonuclease [Cyanomargarita calcarea GSE-NOS-MK-12-04C]|jgi:Uma2 family endonuclease|uniref:Uma2 family endonuclease n=1 Tax=Cyanomargarita calcarea GSE-NOS-MK-12-04C TaxID=2839659 RepID=A0A951QMC1_9CYAN|nr:Uma2 family endonuclease [Cyanomargarita calcarea GSE-NOS-MK-12-04C]